MCEGRKKVFVGNVSAELWKVLKSPEIVCPACDGVGEITQEKAAAAFMLFAEKLLVKTRELTADIKGDHCGDQN